MRERQFPIHHTEHSTFTNNNNGRRPNNGAIVPNDEVDLLALLSSVIGTISRHAKLIIIFAVICIGSGIVYNALAPDIYHRSMASNIPWLDKAAVEQVLNEIENRASAVDKSDPLSDLVSLELKEGEKGKTEESTFVFEAKLNGKERVAEIEKSVINHFNENSFIKLKAETERKSIEGMIAKLANDEKQIDELLSTSERFDSESISIAELSKLKMDFYKERIALESKLASMSGIIILQNFTGEATPANKNIVITAAVCFAAWLLISFVVISVIEIKRVLPAYGQKTRPKESAFKFPMVVKDQTPRTAYIKNPQ